ncbi:MAG: lysylphosphatidylglycerol synthase transmembrane domain-containing protein [Steroidobacteraceae bacterium]
MKTGTDRRWPRWATVAMQIAFGAGIFAACLLLPDLSGLPGTLAAADPWWLLGALLLAIVGTVLLPSLMTREALAIDRIGLSLVELIRINFAIRFYVLVLPRAASIGIRWLRYMKGGGAHDAMALMVYERLMQLFTMTLIGTIVLGTELDALGDSAAGIFVAALGCTTLLAAMLIPFLWPIAAGWLAAAVGIAERIAPAFLTARARRLLDSVTAFHQLRAPATLKILAWSLLSYLLFIGSPWAVVFAMDVDISLPALAWIRPLVFLLTLLPLTIGGIGVREAGFIGLLHLYGVAAGEALAFSLVLFAIQVAIGVVGMATELKQRIAVARAATS